jgi:hypothetical protein
LYDYESGEFVDGTPVILSTPINIGKSKDLDLNSLNYNPSKIWKINSSFNLFNTKTTGDFMYTNSQNKVIIQNLDNEAFSWFTRINS